MSSYINADLFYDKEDIVNVAERLKKVCDDTADKHTKAVISDAVFILEEVANEIADDFDDEYDDEEDDEEDN